MGSAYDEWKSQLRQLSLNDSGHKSHPHPSSSLSLDEKFKTTISINVTKCNLFGTYSVRTNLKGIDHKDRSSFRQAAGTSPHDALRQLVYPQGHAFEARGNARERRGDSRKGKVVEAVVGA